MALLAVAASTCFVPLVRPVGLRPLAARAASSPLMVDVPPEFANSLQSLSDTTEIAGPAFDLSTLLSVVLIFGIGVTASQMLSDPEKEPRANAPAKKKEGQADEVCCYQHTNAKMLPPPARISIRGRRPTHSLAVCPTCSQFGWIHADHRIPLPSLAELQAGCHLVGQRGGLDMYLCKEGRFDDLKLCHVRPAQTCGALPLVYARALLPSSAGKHRLQRLLRRDCLRVPRWQSSSTLQGGSSLRLSRFGAPPLESPAAYCLLNASPRLYARKGALARAAIAISCACTSLRNILKCWQQRGCTLAVTRLHVDSNAVAC